MREVLLWVILIINVISLCLLCKQDKTYKERFAEYGTGYFVYPCYQTGDCPNNMRCVPNPYVKDTYGLCSP